MSATKSAIGHRHNVCEPPPHANGKAWWTSPPVSSPDPSQLAFAMEFKRELTDRYVALMNGPRGRGYSKQQTEMGQLIGRVRDWIKRANVLANEFEYERLGLGTTDGLIVEANRLVYALKARSGGYDAMEGWERSVADALQRTAGSILQQRSGRGGMVRRAGAPRRGGGK